MSGEQLVLACELVFLVYVVTGTLGYLFLNLVALAHVSRYLPTRALEQFPRQFSGLEPPISILAPAYNEETTITASIRSLLQLHYTEHDVIVINDGSTDRTLEVLIGEFGLMPVPEAYDARLPMKPIRAIYGSARYPSLRVIDKENGGKADALNAGINLSRNPLFCCIDADSVLERDSLYRVVQPFLEDPHTVACGGTIRIANGCDIRGGFLAQVGLPTNGLALFQTVEYLRAFLFGRMGWSPMNAMLVISGAFGLFRRDTVVEAGGYRRETIGEDMDLVVRLHRHLRLQERPYRIAYIPDPVCWTEAPEDIPTLRAQRIRWQRGLSESLTHHWDLLCHPRGGAVGWIAFPFMVLWEWLGPLFEFIGCLFLVTGALLGVVSLPLAAAFASLSIVFGVLLSVTALLLEELTFHVYPKSRQVLLQYLVAIAENFGYRQLISWWRLIGLVRWLRGEQASWGKMTRWGSWQTP